MEFEYFFLKKVWVFFNTCDKTVEDLIPNSVYSNTDVVGSKAISHKHRSKRRKCIVLL